MINVRGLSHSLILSHYSWFPISAEAQLLILSPPFKIHPTFYLHLSLKIPFWQTHLLNKLYWMYFFSALIVIYGTKKLDARRFTCLFVLCDARPKKEMYHKYVCKSSVENTCAWKVHPFTLVFLSCVLCDVNPTACTTVSEPIIRKKLGLYTGT